MNILLSLPDLDDLRSKLVDAVTEVANDPRYSITLVYSAKRKKVQRNLQIGDRSLVPVKDWNTELPLVIVTHPKHKPELVVTISQHLDAGQSATLKDAAKSKLEQLKTVAA